MLPDLQVVHFFLPSVKKLDFFSRLMGECRGFQKNAGAHEVKKIEPPKFG